MALLRSILPTAVSLLVSAGALVAQAPAKAACDIQGSKGALARVAFTVEQARAAQGTPGAGPLLSNAVKQIEGAGSEDPTASALYMGQVLSLWLSQPGISYTPKRSTLGFTTNPEGTLDLVAAIDSSFRIVETAKPGCAELTTAYRGGLPGYLTLVNGAINSLNADKLDSAEYYGTQALRLYPSSPYASMVLGSVAEKRSNHARALEYWTISAAAASKDSIYRDVQRQVLGNAGFTYLSMADAATGAERVAAARHAMETYGQLIAIPGTKGYYLTNGRQNYQRSLLLAGDTTAFVASYAPLLSNPTDYDAQDLLNTAVNVARANRGADAARLFEAALAKNPYQRDALYNLGLTYLATDQNTKVAPIVTRLVAVDPGNPENYNLAARAYLALAKAAEKAGQKGKPNPTAVALNDSTMQWYTRGNKLPVEVVVNEFTPGEKSVIVGGRVLDRRDKIEVNDALASPVKGAKGKAAPKPAAPTFSPTAVTLKVEAIDAAGNSLGSQTVTTEPLSPGSTANFRVTIPATNAVGFRYTMGG
jgi:tetratricopeptide (TPR) repeat protein